MPMIHGLGFSGAIAVSELIDASASNAELKQVAFSPGVQLNPNILEW